MQQSNIETFAAYSQFKSLKDFNNNLESFLSIHKKDLNPKEVYCLKALSRFAVRCLGVSNISINKLLTAISNKFKKVSESTFHRFKRKAIKLGILSVYPLSRSNGSQSSNLWVFNRFISNDTRPKVESDIKTESYQQSEEKAVTPHSKPSSIKTNIQIKRISGEHDIVPDWITIKNPELVKTASYYFNSCEIKEFMIGYMSVSKKSKLDCNKLRELSVKAMEQTVLRLKSNKRIDNNFAYYLGVLKRKEKAEYLKHLWDLAWG